MSCCPDCCKYCCPCLTPSKLKRSSKYAYVKYTPSKELTPSPRSMATEKPVPVPDIEVAHLEKVFKFPQEKSDFGTHPQMFMEDTVTEQPRSQSMMKRFSSLPVGTVPIGGELDYYSVATAKAHTLPRSTSSPATSSSPRRGSSISPRKGNKGKLLSPGRDSSARRASSPDVSRSRDWEIEAASVPEQVHTLPRMSGSGSLPTFSPPPPKSDGSSKKSLLKRRRSIPTESEDPGWVPGLPVLEETTLDDGMLHPLLQFSLHYDVQKCTLTVHLHHGSNLPAKDRRGTSDPFVVLYMVPNKEEIFESKVIYQTLDPVFNQSFEFKHVMPDEIRRQTLVFCVYDHDKFSKNDTIGGVVFPLENADLFGVVMRMKIDENPNLLENTRGDLLLALSYDLTLSSIKGVVLKATNLKKQDVIGLADPYVKIRLHYKKKLLYKWKSSIKRNTLIPVFNESFQFDVLGKELDDIVMEVMVMDYDRFSKNDVVGKILFGSSVTDEAQLRHWRDMIDNSPQIISQWHTIHAP